MYVYIHNDHANPSDVDTVMLMSQLDLQEQQKIRNSYQYWSPEEKKCTRIFI